MDYIELDCTVSPKDKGLDVVVAALSDIGFESFEETAYGVKAYIQAPDYNKSSIEALPYLKENEFFSLKYEDRLIVAQNWNAVWESNFEPVIIQNVSIRAPFHDKPYGIAYDLIIEPKMSFGTGHHETTALMVEEILKLDFKNKSVLDMGCGTGILALLAAKIGARQVTAIDIDEWAYKNTLENLERNGAPDVQVLCGTIDLLKGQSYDIILANINRNILLKDLLHYNRQLPIGGTLVMSGFLDVDLPIMRSACMEAGFKPIHSGSIKHWTLLNCIKEK
jgi:ribosomal protein L11 methyltransferase